ncbi:EpsG family protein [Chitinophaga sp. G-6-1-13]|uniref:EpsG family protein n=1 Tax=Chitinophaga fulva TaxID=2728842 RepID=A0A848GDP1_9BACT|nr:EpsG family protein [Chitinophaga fulva]NML35831.1 EpsG family protein [Chitinophaga fulva]
MIFYITIFLVLSSLLVLDFVKNADSLRRLIFFLVIAFFVFLAGLRWETGTDWNNYYSFFKNMNAQVLEEDKVFEPGFKYVNFWVRSYTDDYTVFLMICAVFIISLKSYYFYRNTSLIFLAAFLYYAYFFFDIFFVRQSLAISFVLISSPFIVKRKFIPFAILIYLASLFHGSALVFLLAYFVYNLNMPGYVIFLIIAGSIFFSVLSIDALVLKAVVQYMGGNAYIASKLEGYLEVGQSESFNSALGKTTVLLLGVLKRGVLVPIFIWFRDKIDKADYKEYNGYLNLFVMGTALYFITSNYMALQRISTYFTLFEILLVLMVARHLRGKVAASIVYTVIVLYAFTKFYYGFASYKDLYVPYYSIFDSNIERVVY